MGAISAVSTAVPLTQRALLKRVNRHLAQRGEQLYKAKQYARSRVGCYYVINTESSVVTGVFVDLEACARQLGVLRSWEEIR